MTTHPIRKSTSVAPVSSGMAPPTQTRVSQGAPTALPKSIVEANYLALRNDLEQAIGLANDVQSQLCDKSNEVAQLKVVCERTQADLRKLHADIQSLREERHHLANELQLADGVHYQLQKMIAERDRLVHDLAAEQQAHTAARETGERKVAALRHLLDQSRKTAAPAVARPVVPQEALDEVHAALAKLANCVEVRPTWPSAPAQAAPKLRSTPEPIDIDFLP